MCTTTVEYFSLTLNENDMREQHKNKNKNNKKGNGLRIESPAKYVQNSLRHLLLKINSYSLSARSSRIKI